MSSDLRIDQESGLLDINSEHDAKSSVSSKSLTSRRISLVSGDQSKVKPKVILGHSNQWLDDFSKLECRRITELSDRNIKQTGETYREDTLVFGQANDQSPLSVTDQLQGQIQPSNTMNPSRSRESLRIVSSDMQTITAK